MIRRGGRSFRWGRPIDARGLLLSAEARVDPRQNAKAGGQKTEYQPEDPRRHRFRLRGVATRPRSSAAARRRRLTATLHSGIAPRRRDDTAGAPRPGGSHLLRQIAACRASARKLVLLPAKSAPRALDRDEKGAAFGADLIALAHFRAAILAEKELHYRINTSRASIEPKVKRSVPPGARLDEAISNESSASPVDKRSR